MEIVREELAGNGFDAVYWYDGPFRIHSWGELIPIEVH
jgi:hypothetical protein